MTNWLITLQLLLRCDSNIVKYIVLNIEPLTRFLILKQQCNGSI